MRWSLLPLDFAVCPPQEIAARLTSKFRLLNNGDPALPRHRTLHATLDWSYDLLNEAEQRLLRYVSVFRGGWTLEATEGISRMNADETVTALTALVDKSLIVYETASGQDRYRLLEMTRQYAAERLDAQEQTELQQRHAESFYGMARSEAAGAENIHLPEWSLLLWQERDNFRAAHAWYQQHNAEDALWLEFFLYTARIWPSENDREWVGKLQREPMPPTMTGLLITYCVGTWALWKGHPACETILLNLLASARLCGDDAFQTYALYILSSLEEERGNYQGMLDYVEQAIAVAPREVSFSLTAVLRSRAARQLARLGRAEQAINRLQMQIQAGRRNGGWQLLSAPLCDLGGILFEQGDYAGAQNAWQECVSLAEQFYPAGLPDLLATAGGGCPGARGLRGRRALFGSGS